MRGAQQTVRTQKSLRILGRQKATAPLEDATVNAPKLLARHTQLPPDNLGWKHLMTWTVVNFGRYRRKTLPQIVLIDPDWFFWAVEKQIFNKSPQLKREANDIYRKATRIRVTGPKGSKMKVEYAIHPRENKLADVSVIPASQPQHQGSTPTLVEDVFDLSMARQICPYDKLGGQIIVRALKFHVFVNENARLTRQRCAKFFDDDSNFA
jgi:hypothetical protein